MNVKSLFLWFFSGGFFLGGGWGLFVGWSVFKASNVMAQPQHAVTQQGTAHYLYWRFENQIAGADFFFVISIA